MSFPILNPVRSGFKYPDFQIVYLYGEIFIKGGTQIKSMRTSVRKHAYEFCIESLILSIIF